MDRNQLVKALQWEWTEWMERIEPCVEIGEVGGRIFSFGEIKSAKVEWGNLSPHGLELTLHFEFKWRAKRGEDYKWERDTDTLDIQVYYQEDENPVSLYFHKQNSPLILRCLGFNIRKHQLWEIMGIPQPPRPKTNANAWLSIVTQ